MAESKLKARGEAFKELSSKDKTKRITDLLLNNAMYIIIILAVIYISIKVPAFLKLPSIVNVISLTAAKLPIALGIGGCADRYGYFRGSCSWFDGLYFRIASDNYL